jgi:hypothetical protein
VRENKVISLDKRAEDEEKSFFRTVASGGARKLLRAAIENEVVDAQLNSTKDRRDQHGQRLVTGKALNPGVSCLGSSNAWALPAPRSWPSAPVP